MIREFYMPSLIRLSMGGMHFRQTYVALFPQVTLPPPPPAR